MVEEDVLSHIINVKDNWPFKYSVGKKVETPKTEPRVPEPVEKKFRLAQLKTFKLRSELKKLEVQISELQNKPEAVVEKLEEALL